MWLIVSYGGVHWCRADILREYMAVKPFEMIILAAYGSGSRCDGGNNHSTWS